MRCQVTVEEDLDALFRGMASTIAEREDAIIVPDLTGVNTLNQDHDCCNLCKDAFFYMYFIG